MAATDVPASAPPAAPPKRRGPARRVLKALAWVLGVLVVLPVALLGAVLVAGNLQFGQTFLVSLAARLTAGQVVAEGLSGRFPDDLRLRHVAVRDADSDRLGPWLVIENLTLTWSPLELVQGQGLIRVAAAEGVHVLRLPAPSPAPAGSTSQSSSSFSLPVRLALERLSVGRLELDAPVAGAQIVAALEGTAHLASLQQGDAQVSVRDLDAGGTYRLAGSFAADRLTADLSAQEPPGGLAARVAKLPDLGAIALQARLDGPLTAAATRLSLSAGELRAQADGTLNLTDRAADVQLSATAPAMRPRPDVAWRSVAVQAHLRGPFTAPEANGTVRAEGLEAAGAAIRSLAAEIGGNTGRVRLDATAEGVRIPGPKPDLLEAAPLRLTAEAGLDAPGRPVTFTLAHPLIAATGQARTEGTIQATAHLTLPDLAPLAALGGTDLRGRAALDVQAGLDGGTTTLAVDGTVGITGGLAPVPALIGPDGRVGVTAALAGTDVTLSRLEVNGRALRLSAQGSKRGTERGGAVDLGYDVGVTDLAALTPAISGALRARGQVAGHLAGSPGDLSATADLSGDVGTKAFPRGPVEAHLRAQGLPDAPTGEVTAQGTLDGAPLSLAATARRDADGTLRAEISRGDWKSAHLAGSFTLPPGAAGAGAGGLTLPLGHAEIRVARLADLKPVTGLDFTGSLQATADLGTDEARVEARAQDAGIPGTRIGRATLSARVQDPLGHPAIAAQLAADGIDAAGISGTARVEANGKQEALAVRLSANLHGLAGADAQASGAAVVDVPGKQVSVSALQATWRAIPVRLLAPVRVSFGQEITVDRLRLAVKAATAEVAGRVSPTLDLTAQLRNVTADLAQAFAPELKASGTVGADARLTGTPARPEGTVRVTATGLRLLTGPARSLPAASLTAEAALAGTSARLTAQASAGTTRLSVSGTAPLGREGALDLRANGTVDLAVTDPILTPAGRRARGTVTLDVTATGTLAAPRIGGTARLANGEVQDYAQGAHITALNGTVEAAGDTLRIVGLSGRAGPGTIGASGTVGVLAPGIPVDIRVTARDARPLVSDLLTADLNADLTVRGQALGQLALGGNVLIKRAEIRVPESLPTRVAVLDVRKPGQAPPAPAAGGTEIALNLTVDAPGQIFVRGRGLDAELGGQLHLGGTAVRADPSGGFNLRRGQFSLAGTTLTFSRGRVGFNGTGVTGKIDPMLDFEADSTSSGITAALTITGTASAPKFSLTSAPQLPQDEVLARLLFGRSAKDLGPFQYAAIAQAVAQLSGVGGGVDPLNSIRQGLGLDRLQITGNGSNSSNPNGASVEAGRYVAPGVYLGVKQGTEGTGSQAQVQIDLWRGLKLQTDVGSGTGGNSVGLTYEFEY